MALQDDESNDEYDVGQREHDTDAGQLVQPEPNESIQFLQVETSGDRDASSVSTASANDDPLGNETADHSALHESNKSIECLEFETVADGDASPLALDSLDSCDHGAAGYSADHERPQRLELLKIEYAPDGDEVVSFKEESFGMVGMRSSLESTNTSDCQIVAEYRELLEEVDDTSAE